MKNHTSGSKLCSRIVLRHFLSALVAMFSLCSVTAFGANTINIASTTCGTFSTSPSSPLSVAKNGSQNVTFTPGSNYTYSSVSINNSGSTGIYAGGFKLSPKSGDDNVTYTATVTCTAITKTVTVTPGAGGTIACSGAGCSNTWLQNSTATYVITPSAGYVLNSYTIDSTTTTPTSTVYSNTNPLTVTIPIGTTNHTISTSFTNTRNVTITQNGNPTGTVTSCPTAGTTAWPATGTTSYSISPTVGTNSSLISSISISPTAPQTGATQTIAVANGGTGYTCSSPLVFNMNGLNQTLTINYSAGASVTKTIKTNGAVSSTGGAVASCSYYGSDNWPATATASYSILPSSGYILSTAVLSPATATKNPAGSIQASGYSCGDYTFPIGAQAQSLTVNFVSAVPVTSVIKMGGTTTDVTLNCAGVGVTGICTATNSGGGLIGTLTSCNGSNYWGTSTNATYMITPGSGYKLLSVTGGSTTVNPAPAGGYSSCSTGFTFGVGAAGTTLTADFALSASSAITGQVAGVAGGDIQIGGVSIVPGPYNSPQNSPVTTSFVIPAGAGIKNLYWTPSGGSAVDVTAMLTCASLSPPDFTSNTCQFTIPAVSGTSPSGITFTGVGTSGGTIKALFDTAYAVTATATTTGCGGSNGGLVNGAGTRTYNVVNGSTITITGGAASGYVIKDVTLNDDSIGVSVSSLGTSFSKAFGPITSAGNKVNFIFTPVYTVNSNAPVSDPVASGATGTIVPGTQTVMCGAAIQAVTITPTAPATIQNVALASPDGTTVSLGVVSVLDSTISQLASVQKPWTITVTFNQVPITANDYTIVPPFVQAAVLPNLLLMIDNSSSQYDLQYDSTGQCYDNNSYLNTTTYSGYFDNTSLYSYVAANNRFESGATLPAGCTYRTPYFCVNMAGTKPNRTVSTFVATGNYLNYLTMSKLDMQKKILTGGKYDASGGNLVAESRGCNGKRFAKIISNTQASGSTEDVSGITFVIRGPNASDGANFNPAVTAGTTRIDLYDYSYANQIATCQTAFDNWATGANQGTTQGNTDACISSSVTDPKFDRVVQMIHACYYTVVKGNAAPPNGQLDAVGKSCEDEYKGVGVTATAPSAITNNQAGDAVCSSVIQHKPMNGRDVGYLGVCWDTASSSFPNGYRDQCLVNQIVDFCDLMNQSQVTDPTGTGNNADAYTSSMPGFFMDAGINSLGKPANATPYLANVKVTTPQPPTGLIEEFKSYINFGAMVFNEDGSGKECTDVTSTTVLGSNQIPCARHCSNDANKACYFQSDCGGSNQCVTNTKLDGGKIITSIIDHAGVGDHSSGLINSIDNIKATSWTPWAEAYYNAIGYFAGNVNLRLQSADWDSSQTPPSERCRLNNILIITDGGSTADQNVDVATLAGKYNDGTGTESYGPCDRYQGSKNLSAMSWMAKNKNITTLSAATATAPTQNNQSITTYVTYSGPAQTAANACDPSYLMSRVAINGGTTMYQATSSEAMLDSLREAFKKIATTSASGTAASILNNSEGSGANLLQAVFYPKKTFDKNTAGVETSVNWIGELQNLWYYVDPFFNRSTIREDTDSNYTLNLQNDYSVKFRFDPSENETYVDLARDVTGTGSSYLPIVTTEPTTPDDTKSLWRAGKLLWSRDLSANPRKIYTSMTGGLTLFSSDTDDLFVNNTAVWPLMQTNDEATTRDVINYIHGVDKVGLRNRTVRIGGTALAGPYNTWKLGDIVDSTPKTLSNQKLNTYDLPAPTGYADSSYTRFVSSKNYKKHGMVFVGANDGMLHAFRLGLLDVTNQTATTKARLLQDSAPGTVSSTTFAVPTVATSTLGEEAWAFIPKNVLPYLKYYTDPTYNHLYYVDNTVTLFDASINKASTCTTADYWNCPKITTLSSGELTLADTSWRSILIGGMGYGGASHDLGSGGCNQCVITPVAGLGLSSYFALDVTNPEVLPPASGAVSLKWEFNGDGELGYATTGPAVARVGSKEKNGRWFAVFASGPTGPINSTTHSFLGASGQSLKIFVLDLNTGTVLRKITNLGTTASPGVTLPVDAFAGSISNSVIDTDKSTTSSPGFYSDDAIYISYTRKCTAAEAASSVCPAGTWTRGGVLRILTKESTDPNLWEVSEVIKNIGPVTTSVTKLQDRSAKYDKTKSLAATGKLWLYFGTGRFYYKGDSSDTAFRLYGIEEPCYSINSGDPQFTPTGPRNDFGTDSCISEVLESSLQNQTGTATTAPLPVLPVAKRGWYVDLATSASGYQAERSITNPVASPAGAVFFTTFQPSSDVCSFLGNSYIWALGFNSGAAPPAAAMKGRALLQVSTGEIKEVALTEAFKRPTRDPVTGEPVTGEPDQRYEDRRTFDPITGMPPTAQGLALMSNPKPAKKIMHIQEK